MQIGTSAASETLVASSVDQDTVPSASGLRICAGSSAMIVASTQPVMIMSAPNTGRHQACPGFSISRWYGIPVSCTGLASWTTTSPPGVRSGLRDPTERALPTEELQRLEQRRRHPSTGHRDADGAERVLRLQPEPVDERVTQR